MHAAPPVRVSLGSSPGWHAFDAACVGMATANAVVWALLRVQVTAVLPLALALGATAAGVAVWRLRRTPPPGELLWDGAQWLFRGSTGDARVALDLGHWMLLRFDGAEGRRFWIAAARRTTDGPWSLFRAALYSRRPAAALDALK